MTPQVTREQRIFTAVVISGMACGANAVLIFGLATPRIAIWQTLLAWLAGAAIALAAIYMPAQRLKSPYFLVIAAVPFAVSFLSPDFAGLFFAACAGGIAAVAMFAIARVGPSDESGEESV